MIVTFDKSLLLCPVQYSLFGPLKHVLKLISKEVNEHNIRHLADRFEFNVHSQIFRFPFTIRNNWETYFLNKLNKRFRDYFTKLMPDLVLVYNSEFLTPDTCELIKKYSKLIFFLADSPFYTKGNDNYLTILKYADLILSPDTFWIQQLNTIGLTKTKYFINGLNKDQYFEMPREEISNNIIESEIFYAGMNYANSWGYKKALFMNQFIDYDLHIYGSKHWKKWFYDFPALKDKFTESRYIPVDLLNAMMNKSKLIPVDGNPGILNGFHLRLIEALGAGTLPLVEYRRDVDHELFNGCKAMVPLIYDYRKASDLAGYFLKNENERKDLVRELKEHIINQYSSERNAERILDWLSGK